MQRSYIPIKKLVYLFGTILAGSCTRLNLVSDLNQIWSLIGPLTETLLVGTSSECIVIASFLPIFLSWSLKVRD